MKKNSNTYVILYSSVMVILVAVGLALTSQALKDRQSRNVDLDTMRQILRSLSMDVDPTLDTSEALYSDLIKEAYLVDATGNIVAGSEGNSTTDPAFLAALDLAKLSTMEGYPVFVAEIDGQKKYILGMYGAGLWGPIWGYIALNEDANTVYGVNLDHASETPGLGADIALPKFRERFEGKEIYKNGMLKSIAVVKPNAVVEDMDRVDGISGGTLTSNGVNNMLLDAFKRYQPYLDNLRK
ncbi:MAG: NADH:ubiquinone reductase (Na(+)-transporting) subunit C [Bacteroidales bacterium]|uniref:NADH:ubiquinone reductase (Na(+)-transporting) subunit C n=1 Tax=Porphyromonas sp. TaxID=1924944 RepID=UPI00297136D1|nr:NADH:ubiquinone reductase (Na(+)-transporting) subunit C [Porphyromonas sp.]MDD7438816.1 NADH:ubiquinone reductase (Na(+)-transporting) subunit C [Bacteroidales bacterium]MDY3066863.1 NADH:ubiquinone reductase (Na(+)-transporting) subunit C [Porphyromonas sp.]